MSIHDIQFRQTSASTACDKPCWWGKTTSHSSPQVYQGFNRYFNAAQGERIRVWGKPTHEFSGSAVVIAANPIAVTVNVLDYRYAKGQADGLMSYSPLPQN